MKIRRHLPFIILTTFCVLLILCITSSNHLFGSDIDWLSQHITIPEHFRTQFYQTGNLFPDFIDGLGAGQNVYNFSYYGLYRLDILVSYLLPFIDMKTIITGYMILCYIVSVNLMYYWLKKHDIKTSIGIFVAILFACSPILFHSHRQIMFVNYMPFLLLALLNIDRYIKDHKILLLIISIFLIINHSYYYSISAILECIVYYLYALSVDDKFIFSKETMKLTSSFFICIVLAIFLSGILLLPTALTLLENSRNSSDISILTLFIPNLDVNALLYHTYGVGLTFFVWISIVIGICYKKTRSLSIVSIIAIVFPFVSYILNGTLYARSKILLVLIPILLYLVAMVIQEVLNKQEIQYRYFLIVTIIPLFFNNNINWLDDAFLIHIFVLLDVIFSILIFGLLFYTKKTKYLFLACIFAIGNCIYVNLKEESYVLKTTYDSLHSPDKQELLASIPNTTEYRFDDLSSTQTSNTLENSNLKKTSIYSSIYTSSYHAFFYDIVQNPYTTRNSMSMNSGSNIFFQTLMGVKYIYTNTIPPYWLQNHL